MHRKLYAASTAVAGSQHHSHCRRPKSLFAAGRLCSLVRSLALWMVPTRQLCHGPYPESCSKNYTSSCRGLVHFFPAPCLPGPSTLSRGTWLRFFTFAVCILCGTLAARFVHPALCADYVRNHSVKKTLLLAPMRSMMGGAASQLRTGVARALRINLKVCGGPSWICACPSALTNAFWPEHPFRSRHLSSPPLR